MTIRAVVFDIGETLVDETRHWGEWADWLGVPRLAFFASLGAVIERREPHRAVFELVRPDLPYEAMIAARRAADPAFTRGMAFTPADLYPDVADCLRDLHALGYEIGVSGNQPEGAVEAFHRLGLPVDRVASSTAWGVAKPDPAFFTEVAAMMRLPPPAIAYVGDRLDNDALPAQVAGMAGVFIRRGPWGMVQATWPEASRVAARIDALAELPPVLARLSSGPGP